MPPMQDTPLTGLPFYKMHGLGNDFVVIDRRARVFDVPQALVIALADRHRGVGFDQLAVIDNGQNCDARLTFYNADGSTSAACGNATRCIARMILDEAGKPELRLETERGVLAATDLKDGTTAVNMGPPQTLWSEIPLATAMDTLQLPIEGGPVGTGMGNPHCTFFVADAEAVPLETFGPRYETHPLFPQRTNVQVAQVTGPDHIRMRVWERGVGVTLASGSSSCAVAVAAARRALTGRKVTVDLDGGTIEVDWREDGVWMSGPTMTVFEGHLTRQFLDSLK
ncbi:diaminopimelate epimerase [Tropicimonas sp. S265A]|uniref:diaminopimelate epimerase n=1 Tax=Tropicimonas sp. S265A TaxID=3415134 RepID=UPI003C7CE7AF